MKEIIEVKFNNGLFAINREKDIPFRVRAPFQVHHGDVKRPKAQHFYGLEKDEEAKVITIFQNLYGMWCKLKTKNDIMIDVAPRELICLINEDSDD